MRSSVLSEGVWLQLLNHRDPEIRRFFSMKMQRENQKFSEPAIRTIFNNQYPDVKLAVLRVEGVKIPGDVLKAAMKSTDPEIRRAAFAPNLDIPEELLKDHIKDAWIIKDASVGLMVLEHPKAASQDIAEGLSQMYVVAKVTGSDAIPTILSVLQNHTSQKAVEILNCLDKINLELSKKIGNI
jgi:hypothetical protein